MNEIFEEPAINLTKIFEDAETLSGNPEMGGGVASSAFPQN